MRKLFDTADLEAELFEGEQTETLETEVDITYEEAEDLEVGFSEEDIDDFPALEFSLTLADGRILDYEAVGIFIHEEKEYMVLHPKTDTDGIVHLMELMQGEDDEIQLLPVKDEDYEAVSETFHRVYAEECSTE